MCKRIITLLIMVTLLITAFFMSLYTLYPVKHMDIIRHNSGRLDPGLLCAVIHTESKFRTEARSGKGAAGLMQITEGTAVWMAAEMKMTDFDISDILDPEINIAIGCFYLNWLMDYYDDDLYLTLCAYNAGLGNVNRWLNDPRYSKDGKTLEVIPFPETDQYVKRVEMNQKIYDFILTFRRK